MIALFTIFCSASFFISLTFKIQQANALNLPVEQQWQGSQLLLLFNLHLIFNDSMTSAGNTNCCCCRDNNKRSDYILHLYRHRSPPQRYQLNVCRTYKWMTTSTRALINTRKRNWNWVNEFSFYFIKTITIKCTLFIYSFHKNYVAHLNKLKQIHIRSLPISCLNAGMTVKCFQLRFLQLNNTTALTLKFISDNDLSDSQVFELNFILVDENSDVAEKKKLN